MRNEPRTPSGVQTVTTPGFVGIFFPAGVIIQSSKSLSSSKIFLPFECQFELKDTA